MRYQSPQPKRRFLAGVRCPKCQALDAVVQVNITEPTPDEYIDVPSADITSIALILISLAPKIMLRIS